VYFWAVKPSIIKYTKLGKKNYKALSVQKIKENFYVTCYDWFEKSCYLILGDEFGNITVWCCKPLMDHLKLLQQPYEEVVKEWNEK